MSDISPQRQRIFKLLILLFCIGLFAVGSSLLFLFDVVSFEWSRNLENRITYESNKAKERRILVLGDSQLAEEVAERSLHKQIKSFCKAQDIGFASGAFPGYGPREYHAQLKAYAADYHPDLILIFYNFHNDLTDVLYGLEREEAYELEPLDIDTAETVKAEFRKINSSKETNNVIIPQKNPENLKHFDWKKFEEYGFDPKLIRYAKNSVITNNVIYSDTLINPHLLIMAMWQPEYLAYNLELRGERSKFAWYNTLKILDDMMNLAQQLNSRVAIIGIPSTLQVNESHYDFFEWVKLETERSWTHTSLPQHLMDTFATASGAAFVNLLPPFRAETNIELYYKNNDHLNNHGHDLAFSLLKDQVLQPYVKNQLGELGKVRTTEMYKAYNEWKRSYYAFKLKKRLGISSE